MCLFVPGIVLENGAIVINKTAIEKMKGIWNLRAGVF